jgi:prepilin-type N-terminal cleavage/methylation domain-containing protein
MPNTTTFRNFSQRNRFDSFTLVELLIVMAVIAILTSIVLFAASGALAKAKRSRAAAEIQAISAALESYKTDNGAYPSTNAATGFAMSTSSLLTNSAAAPYFSTTLDGTSSQYYNTSQLLFINLTGMTNFSDTAAAGPKSYLALKAVQVGDPTGALTGASYIKDPWGYSYAYSIGTAASSPYSGSGFFDLWSTGGTLSSSPNTNAWISNWQ